MDNATKILCGLCGICFVGCTARDSSVNTEENSLPVPNPDSIGADYSYLDSIDNEIKKASMELYGDSDMLERVWNEGLPDSMKLHNE